MLIKFLLNGKEVNLTGDNITIKSTNFNVDKNGNMTCKSGNFNGTITSNNANITGGKIKVSGQGTSSDLIRVENSSNSNEFSYIQPVGAGFKGSIGRIDIMAQGSSSTLSSIDLIGSSSTTSLTHKGITTPSLNQTSLENQKKNFEKLENALKIVKDTDIYKYNLKFQNNKDKKHIGFVIGKDYKYSSEITCIDENGEETGVDLYSMIAVAYKAIQEQQEQIEELTRKIEEKEATNGNN